MDEKLYRRVNLLNEVLMDLIALELTNIENNSSKKAYLQKLMDSLCEEFPGSKWATHISNGMKLDW